MSYKAFSKDSYLFEKDGALYVRVPYRDPRDGKWRSKCRRVNSRAEGRTVAARLKTELGSTTAARLEGESITVGELLTAYPKPFPKWYAALIRESFGERKLKAITYEELAQWREQRAAVKHRYTHQPRSARTINGEINALQKLFAYARKRGLLAVNPFELGENLAPKALEGVRHRLPTEDELERLLAHAKADRAHLKPIILIALDTGLRKGRILSLLHSELDFAQGLILLGRPKHKTKKHPPVVAMTARVRAALADWLATAPPGDPAGRLFPMLDFKRSWRTLCRLAGVEDLHFHDLRHSYVTRAIVAGLPRDLVMKTSGHTETATFDRYLNVDISIARLVATALESSNSVANLVTNPSPIPGLNDGLRDETKQVSG